jgi:hypothetical protein
MPIFALAIFLGAFLLFQVQPMIGKYILPWFGGGPGIWSTCMLFFQLLLLAGYAYAHLLSRWSSPRRQVLVHHLLLGLALCLLPVVPSDSWKPQGVGDPRIQILLLLAACVGLPYFALSATGPLMQHWFSLVRPGASPYRLYALSNAGSLLALLSYPFYFESNFSRITQASIWSWGLCTFVITSGFAAHSVWRAHNASPGTSPEEGAPGTLPSKPTGGESRPPFLTWSLWLLLPACASLLLLATTNKLCQDVTVIPLLWVVPLALYLLSFIICFDSPRWYQRMPFGIALVASLTALCWVLFGDSELSMTVQIGVYAVGLLICCLVCHGELYRLRPSSTYLTHFYLTMAAGGALGGLLVTLVAPLIFTDYYELHWGLLLCAGLSLTAWLQASDWGRLTRWRWHTFGGGLAGIGCLAASLWAQAHDSSQDQIRRTRNFYGVLSVLKIDPSHSGSYALKLTHGITAHGMQLLDPALRAMPTTYYGENSGVGRTFRSLTAETRQIGVIGLGVGTLATYGRPGDGLRIYEINPEVEALARHHFTYLSDCKGTLNVVLGDARLTLEREPAQNFDLLVMDAFSSDAIPMHLLTREAFQLYERHLKTNGVIAVHISNRHLNLEPVVAAVAEHAGYQAAVVRDEAPDDKWWLMNSVWMILTKQASLLSHPSIGSAAVPAQAQPETVRLWTDDFASIYPILRSRTNAAVEVHPGKSLIENAIHLTQKGNFVGAIARYRSALERDPNFVDALNNLAWLLAAGPDPALRQGAEAVQLAERACELTGYQRTFLVGTLAAAYAEAGRFADAVATAEKACALAAQAGDDVLLSRNQQLLQLYRNGKPYHEPAQTP